MTITVDDVTRRLGVGAADAAEVATALTLAQTIVDKHVADKTATWTVTVPPPAAVLDEAVLRVAVDLFNRAQAPNGVLMNATLDTGSGTSAPLRLARDPLWSARAVLAPWLPEIDDIG